MTTKAVDMVGIDHGWRSRESVSLERMSSGFDFLTRYHMWIEFCGSLLFSERFSLGSPVFPSQQP